MAPLTKNALFVAAALGIGLCVGQGYSYADEPAVTKAHHRWTAPVYAIPTPKPPAFAYVGPAWWVAQRMQWHGLAWPAEWGEPNWFNRAPVAVTYTAQ
jgi:hypothetical protein